MIRIAIFTVMALISLVAQAEPITFTNVTTSFTLPAGFTPSHDAPNPKWQYFPNSDVAGIRVMPLMSSTLTPDTTNNIETFWAAQLNATPFVGEIKFITTLDICRGADCAAVTISGTLAHGQDGLVWTHPPTAQNFALGSTLYHLLPALSTRTGVIIPRDAAFTIRPNAEIP